MNTEFVFIKQSNSLDEYKKLVEHKISTVKDSLTRDVMKYFISIIKPMSHFNNFNLEFISKTEFLVKIEFSQEFTCCQSFYCLKINISDKYKNYHNN